MAWTYPVAQHEPKWVRHRCGCPLWVQVLVHMGPVTPFIDGLSHASIPGESILVEYRLMKEDGEPGQVVWQCPQCSKMLKIWWSVEPGEAGKEEEHDGFTGGASGAC